jgi:hypothetical protein
MPTSNNQPTANPQQPSALGQMWNQGTAPLVNFAKSLMGGGSADQAPQAKILQNGQSAGLGANVPENYPLSPDVIDRRQGQTPSLGERVRDLALSVRHDYESSQNHNQGPSYDSPIGPSSMIQQPPTVAAPPQPRRQALQ